ncbi:MAG TPA: PorP/SprF family type IX secretion system membrane protein [Flavipsychrobacter sp.]|nr:PorP/SprF family type IX secretion system membrane protein [Flavipsychrobacter sp.]
MNPQKKYAITFACSAYCLLLTAFCNAQGMHFSQYYNAPLLLNPANTALMPDNDYRVGVNYRNQWAAVPVPYRTYSVYGDLQALRNRNYTNWLGLGFGFWSDKAGNGDLSLSRIEMNVAYHVQMGESAMISAGVSVAQAQRTVDFNKLTFDRQWDGFRFDPAKTNGENGYTARTSFFDLGAGVNLAYFPNENTYLKIGMGLAHLTQPKETFYGQENKMGMRPTGNVDLLVKLSNNVIFNPSVYYTTQKGAMELLYGTQFKVNVSDPKQRTVTALIVGAYHRWNEALVGTLGLQHGQFRFMTSYDYTMSSFNTATKGRGAFEIGIVYEGVYGEFSRTRQSFNCPRF